MVKFVEILELLDNYGQEEIVRAMDKLLGYGIVPTYETVKNVLEQKEIRYEEFEYPGIKIEVGDPQIYDSLAAHS